MEVRESADRKERTGLKETVLPLPIPAYSCEVFQERL